jgi:hypothetical protein
MPTILKVFSIQNNLLYQEKNIMKLRFETNAGFLEIEDFNGIKTDIDFTENRMGYIINDLREHLKFLKTIDYGYKLGMWAGIRKVEKENPSIQKTPYSAGMSEGDFYANGERKGIWSLD